MYRLMVFSLFFLLAIPSNYAESCCSREFDMDLYHNEEPTFLAFVSLSLPEASFKEISSHLEKIEGQFVFRGIPNHSFEGFLKVIIGFREKGILAPIIVDPESFEEYDVTEVPTFVLIQGKTFKKVIGNVSIPYVLETFNTKDEP